MKIFFVSLSLIVFVQIGFGDTGVGENTSGNPLSSTETGETKVPEEEKTMDQAGEAALPGQKTGSEIVPVFAGAQGLGFGFSVGGLSGIVAKYWLSEAMAVDGVVTGNVGDYGDRLYLHLDLLWHQPIDAKVKEGRFLHYYGIGFKNTIQKNYQTGFRVPCGIVYLIPDSPLDFFTEIVFDGDLFKDFNLGLSSLIGMRMFL